ncbi:hypothetical protein I350_04141 [Cryptococcus amylolentus CBS 6273]|uniref:Uncharacterized protein n=1 Tax=Cryptococcus amylolentus CBS 6273 TaxID=1296118 RepID=A0A1E3K3L3_9TREE|nr:hypothetical protein I350_04141 [Cryptococcus amylolentus CBS 6273]
MKNPTLKHFIMRAELLHAYRGAVRSTRPIPDPHTRRETIDFLRADLERLRFEYSLEVLEAHLTSFKRLVKQMAPSFSFSGLHGSGTKLLGQRRSQQSPLMIMSRHGSPFPQPAVVVAGQTKGNHQTLEKTITCAKRRLPFIPFSDPQKVVCSSQVESGEELSGSESVEGFADQGQYRSLIFVPKKDGTVP